jgi:hypothetical protein
MSNATALQARVAELEARCAELETFVETWSYPAAELHKKARFLGGLELLIEGASETAGVDWDRPETVPPPLRALRSAFQRRGAFGLIIKVPNERGVVERWAVEVTAAPPVLTLVKGGKP